MPKIRAIHPSFWNDTTLAECSPSARLFYIGLWNFADDAGVFEWHDKLLKSQIFPFDDTIKVENLLTELIQQKRIASFYHNDKKYGVVLNFTKYQKPDSRYIKYTIGDYEHVKSLFHAESTPCARGEPYTEGDGDGVSDGVSDSAVRVKFPEKPKRALPRSTPPLSWDEMRGNGTTRQVLDAALGKLGMNHFADQPDDYRTNLHALDALLAGKTPQEINAALRKVFEWDGFKKITHLATFIKYLSTRL